MFCHLPRSMRLRHCPDGPCILYTCVFPDTLLAGCAKKAWLQVYHVSSEGRWSQAVSLLAYVNCPWAQEDMVKNWQPVQSLVGDIISVAKIPEGPWLLLLAVTHISLCLPGKKVVKGRWLDLLLYFPVCQILFCEHDRVHYVALEPSWKKVFFCFGLFLI